MNAKNIVPVAVLGLCFALAGCETYTPLAYQIPLGPAQVTSDFGVPNIAVNAVKDIKVRPRAQLYYQVVSPVNIVLYVFDKTGDGPGGPLLGQLQGTTFYSSVLPTSDTVEFVFSATQPFSPGAVQLSVSDSPMTGGSNAIPYTTATMPATPAAQPPVSISPTSISLMTGQSVTFSASGGAGNGAFVWGGAAPASGWSNSYTFNAPGAYTITVYRAGDASYAQSNTASATVNVAPAAAMPSPGYPAVSVTPIH